MAKENEIEYEKENYKMDDIVRRQGVLGWPNVLSYALAEWRVKGTLRSTEIVTKRGLEIYAVVIGGNETWVELTSVIIDGKCNGYMSIRLSEIAYVRT